MKVKKSILKPLRPRQPERPAYPEEQTDFEHAAIEQLVPLLKHRNAHIREQARNALLRFGRSAIPPLIQLLSSPEEQTRWEAAKVLSDLHRPEAAPALVGALIDPSRDVRWLAAEGLIMIGSPALPPLLHGLIEHSDTIWMRQGATIVLHALWAGENADIVGPVLDALQDGAPRVAGPVAAHEALEQIRKRSHSHQ